MFYPLVKHGSPMLFLRPHLLFRTTPSIGLTVNLALNNAENVWLSTLNATFVVHPSLTIMLHMMYLDSICLLDFVGLHITINTKRLALFTAYRPPYLFFIRY